jgi:D-glycero-alpha-D-manno-heptose 1-phosphate guanylyltransferase
LANGGVYWIHPRLLQGLACKPGDKVSLEDDIFPAAMAAGLRLLGLACGGAFIDIGVPADYQRAAQLVCPPSESPA